PRRATHPLPKEQHAYPALSPARGPELCVPLGRSPSLHRLRQPHAFVRRLPRYYATVRLPTGVHAGRAVNDLLRPIRHTRADACGISRFPCKEFPRMRRVFDCAGSADGLPVAPPTVLPSAWVDSVGTPETVIT